MNPEPPMRTVKLGEIDNEQNISIFISGDTVPDGETGRMLGEGAAGKVLNELADVIQASAIRITNLEAPLCNYAKGTAKQGPNIAGNPSSVIGLSKYFNVVTLANNHIKDFGEKGIIETMDLCKEYNVNYIGAGKNKEEASKPLILKVNKKKAGFLNYCEREFSIATKYEAGANNSDLIQIYYDVQRLKKVTDYIFVIYHGGVEHEKFPSPEFKKTLRYIADLGVTAIVAHHTHVISGYEIYNNVPIFYGIGNFIFNRQNRDDSWYKGIAVRFHLNDKGISSFNIIPFKQSEASQKGITLLNGKECSDLFEGIDDINTIIKDEEALYQQYASYINRKRGWHLSMLYSPNKVIRHLFKYKIFQKIIISMHNIYGTYNIIATSSHREALLYYIEEHFLENRKKN